MKIFLPRQAAGDDDSSIRRNATHHQIRIRGYDDDDVAVGRRKENCRGYRRDFFALRLKPNDLVLNVEINRGIIPG